MSYCVNCGVELGAAATACPLCHTQVVNPAQPPDPEAQPFFPTRREEIPPVSRREAALLLSAMLVSVGLCCGLLNLVFYPEKWWSLFAAGAVVTLWIWFVLPLLVRRLSVWSRLTLDVCAVGMYVGLIALALDGMDWFLRLALPIVLCAAAILPIVCWLLRSRRCSILVSTVLVLLAVGAFAVSVELFCDLYLKGVWLPGWSLVILASCVGLAIPLIIVRRVPALREEVRRRFHM